MTSPNTFTFPDPLRRKLMLALPGGLILATPVAMVACGGGGGDGDAPAGPRVQAQMALPASVKASDVSVVSNADEVHPASDGKFSVAVADDSLSLLTAVHSSDRVMYYGLVRTGIPDQSLNARSSAAALLFLALSGPQMTAADRRTLHELILADAQTSVLAGTIQTRVDADPFALDGPDSQIIDAVQLAVQSLRARPASASRSSRERRLAETGVQPLLRLEPGGEVNGISVNQAEGDLAGFNIVNTRRRRGVVRVYKVGYQLADASPANLMPPEVRGARLEIKSTQSLTLFNSLADIVKGSAPFSPVTSERVPLEMQSDAERTFYEVVYLAPLYDAPEPVFFSDARYATNVDIWREDLSEMHRQAQMELVFGAILEALGFGGIAYSNATFNEAIAAMRGAGTADVIQLLAEAGLGKGLLPGFRAWLISVSTGNAIVSGAYRVGVSTLLRGAEAQFAANLAAGTLSRARLLAFHGAMRVMLTLYVVAGVLDTAAQFRDLTVGEKGSLFTATLVAPRVIVKPDSGKVGKGKEQVLTARVTGAQDATLTYRWALTGSSLANLSDKAGKIGATIDTDSATVTLATTPSTVGTLTITVEAFQVLPGGNRSLGKATSQLVMDDTVVNLTPTEARIERVNGSQLFTMSVTPAPAEALSYEWSCPSQWGALSSGGMTTSAAQQAITTTLATATYAGRAGLDGGESETLRCTAFRTQPDPTTGETVRVTVGTASADVAIKQKFNIELPSLPPELPADNTFNVGARITDPVPAGATIEWTWSHSGVGSITNVPGDTNKPNSSVQFAAGSTEGQALFSVSAVVVLAGGETVHVLPVTRGTQVKKGLRTLTVEGYWVVEPGSIPLVPAPPCFPDGQGKLVCSLGNIDTWAVYVLPKVANAAKYDFNIYRPNGTLLASVTLPHPAIVDGGNVWRWRYWALNTPYGSYDGVSGYGKAQADATFYVAYRATNEGPRVAAVVTLKP